MSRRKLTKESHGKSLPLSFVALAAIIYLGLPSLSHATPINISIDPSTGLPAGDIAFKDLPNNNPTSNFNALVTDVGLYDNFFGTNLPDPTMTGLANYEDLDTTGTWPSTLPDLDKHHPLRERPGRRQSWWRHRLLLPPWNDRKFPLPDARIGS